VDFGPMDTGEKAKEYKLQGKFAHFGEDYYHVCTNVIKREGKMSKNSNELP